VIFTAHSLPVRVIEAGDVYAAEVAATARGVADLAGISRFEIAYQSAGRTPEPWIGPDLGELVAARAAAGAHGFLVVPIGFVCDHTEILFDIDVQAARIAREAGATLRRTESLNTSPTFIAALEHIVRGVLVALPG
jgi:ferrochelatase